MVMPIHLDILSDSLAIDLHLANRILDLRYDHVARVDTHRQFRALERAEFYLEGPANNCYSEDLLDHIRQIAVILVRGNHRYLRREVTEYTAHMAIGDFSLPSIWTVTDQPGGLPPLPSTVRLQTFQAGRQLDGFGSTFARYRGQQAEMVLAYLLEGLPYQPSYPCRFRDRYERTARPDLMLVFERLLHVLVALRLALPGGNNTPAEIRVEDYQAARALTQALPMTPMDRQLSPQALKFAEVVHAAVQAAPDQLSLPGLSHLGHSWFTRSDAARWTGLAYNTAKKHLQHLEEEGFLRSTVAESNRERGRQIHYRFAEGHRPSFRWANPFGGLPDLAAPAPTVTV
jgi:hypothetical protein